MTAETSNARWDVVAERQAWYEQQIALAEGQWAAAFLDRWECGDDVPSKEHYVALWLAERAAPPPAGDAEAEALAKYQPCGCVICTCEDEKQCQGCGAKHCGNRTNHPAYVKQQPEARGVVDAKPVGTITRRDSGDEVIEHRIALDPGFEESLYRYPAGTVIHIYAEAAADVALAHVQAAAAALAETRNGQG